MSERSLHGAISDTVREVLTQSRLSQTALAEQLGVHVNTVRRWQAGNPANFELEPIIRLFRFGKKSMDDTFIGDAAENQGTIGLISAMQATIQEQAEDLKRYRWMLDMMREREEPLRESTSTTDSSDDPLFVGIVELFRTAIPRLSGEERAMFEKCIANFKEEPIEQGIRDSEPTRAL